MSGGVDSLEALFGGGGQSGQPAPARRRRRGRGWIIAAWIVGVLAVLVIVAYLVADNAVRSTMETVAAQEIQADLPDGVTGTVAVKIGGQSAILQYIEGDFSDVKVTSPRLTVGGVPAAVVMVANGVSPTLTKPVPRLSGTIGLTPKTVGTLANVQGATAPPTFAKGTMTFTGSQSMDGATVGYTLAMTPSLSGSTLTLTPTKATVTGAPAGADTSALTAALMAQKPTACVATYLPAGSTPTGVAVTTKALDLGFSAKDVKLSGSILGGRGSC